MRRTSIVVSGVWLLLSLAANTGCRDSAKSGDTSDVTTKHDQSESTTKSSKAADAAGTPADAPGKPADPEITAESIGLDPSTKSLGPDPNGIYWFKTPVRGPDGQPLPDKFEHWTYKPKTDTLYQATRGDDGQWKMVERPAVTAESLKLGPGTKYAGKDPLGRYWFKREGHSARVLYDPKSKKMFRAVQQDDGEWKLTEISSTQP